MGSDSKALAGEPKLTRTQSFKMVRLHRRQLEGVDYNPRVITPTAAKKLRENLDTVGQIAPVSVNLRTEANGWTGDAVGRYVILGGHQRVSCIDALEGTDDYMLDVAVVELSEAREVAQNIFLNNSSAQGAFELNMLGDLLLGLEGDGVNLATTGFGTMEIAEMFPEMGVVVPTTDSDPAVADDIKGKKGKKGTAAKAPPSPGSGPDGATATPLPDAPDGAPEGPTEGQETADAGDPAGAYAKKKAGFVGEGTADDVAVLVFKDPAGLAEFRELLGAVPGERYFKGTTFVTMLKRLAKLDAK